VSALITGATTVYFYHIATLQVGSVKQHQGRKPDPVWSKSVIHPSYKVEEARPTLKVTGRKPTGEEGREDYIPPPATAPPKKSAGPPTEQKKEKKASMKKQQPVAETEPAAAALEPEPAAAPEPEPATAEEEAIDESDPMVSTVNLGCVAKFA
jgi:hypothetical protein